MKYTSIIAVALLFAEAKAGITINKEIVMDIFAGWGEGALEAEGFDLLIKCSHNIETIIKDVETVMGELHDIPAMHMNDVSRTMHEFIKTIQDIKGAAPACLSPVNSRKFKAL